MLFEQGWACRAWRGMVVLLAAVAAGCGGGGGGSGGTGSVSVRLDSPASITAEVRQDGTMSNVSLVGSIVGDVAALSGKTLYIVVEDPAQLFEADPFVTYRSSTSLAVNLIGRVLDVAGLRQGQMRIFACLDPACATQLQGSPMAVPYRVDVLPGLTLAPGPLSVATTFGDAEVQRTVTLGLPRDLASFAAFAVSPNGAGASSRVAVGSTQVNGAGGDVVIRFPPAPPGRYAETVRVVATTADLAGLPGRTYQKDITIDYVVADNAAVNLVFSPAETVSNRVQGDNLTKEEPYMTVLRDGATLEWLGLDYLAAPAAAATHPQVNAWWLVGQQGTSTCFNTVSGSDCLPSGTYTARERFRLTVNGVASAVERSITLNITP